jgi:multidrug efflux pump subunit AcrA (membrane-fusion protein)
MAEARRKGISSGVLWIAAAIALIVIFFGVRRLTREKLPIRVAQAQVQDLIKSNSTNGNVEPQHIFEAHAPDAALVKNVYVHQGETVRRGQLLVDMDDTNARARLASAMAALAAIRNSSLYPATSRRPKSNRTRPRIVSTSCNSWRPREPRPLAKWPRHSSA